MVLAPFMLEEPGLADGTMCEDKSKGWMGALRAVYTALSTSSVDIE